MELGKHGITHFSVYYWRKLLRELLELLFHNNLVEHGLVEETLKEIDNAKLREFIEKILEKIIKPIQI